MGLPPTRNAPRGKRRKLKTDSSVEKELARQIESPPREISADFSRKASSGFRCCCFHTRADHKVLPPRASVPCSTAIKQNTNRIRFTRSGFDGDSKTDGQSAESKSTNDPRRTRAGHGGLRQIKAWLRIFQWLRENTPKKSAESRNRFSSPRNAVSFFIFTHNEALSVAAVSVSNPDRSLFKING